AAVDRLDGPLKVRGAATYAFEWPVEHPAYLFPLQATIAAGRITAVDAAAAAAQTGVLAVLTHENAPTLAAAGDADVAVLQSPSVAFRGQLAGHVVGAASRARPPGAVAAATPQPARHAAALVRVGYEHRTHEVVLSADREDLTKPV